VNTVIEKYIEIKESEKTVTGDNLARSAAEFELDNSKYYVTGKQIAEAVQAYYTSGDGKGTEKADTYKNFTTIEAGKHYVINLKVAKKGIERITAAILDWETVNSDDAEAKNTYSTFTLDDRGTGSALGSSSESLFNLYRATQTATHYITGIEDKNYVWGTGYDAATGKSSENNLWKATNWYWENNKTYYHFRAAGATEGASSITIDTDANSCDYFAIGSGSAYKDYIWGAPFNKNTGNTFTYSTTNGFDGTGTSHQLSQAIGATDSQINMLLFHMTSQITVNIKTTTDANNKVTLNDGTNSTKVEILNILPDGKVLMGNGLVSTTSTTRTPAAAMTYGTFAAATDTDPDRINDYTYGIVPQSLAYGGGTIGLRITTPDGNQYVVKDLSTCTATVSSNNIANP
jgi:hypothetical protein